MGLYWHWIQLVIFTRILWARHATYSRTVFPYIAATCLGDILFGYHLSVVNGGPNYNVRDLGFSKITALKGQYIEDVLYLLLVITTTLCIILFLTQENAFPAFEILFSI